MSAFFPGDTAVLSEAHKLEWLQSLNSTALQLSTSDTNQALSLLEEGIVQARIWCRTAMTKTSRGAFSLELAHALRLLARCRCILADYKTVEDPAVEALELYTELQQETEQLEVRNTLAMLHWKTGKYDAALENLLITLAHHQQHGNKTGESRALNNIGLVYDRLGDYSTALDYLLKSIEIDHQLGDKKAEHRAMSNIGIIYSQMGDFQNALEHHQQCLEYEESVGDKDAQCSSLNNIGVVYGRLNHYETSLQYLEKCLQLRRDLGDKYGEALVLCNTGEMFSALGRYEEALHDLHTSMDIYRSQGSNDGMTRALTILGTVYWKQGGTDEAIRCISEALALAEEMGAKTLVYTAHEHLYKIYRQLGDTAQAIEHHELFHDIRDQVFSEANSKRLAALQTLHQVEKSRKEAEIYRLKNIELAQAIEQLKTFNLEKNEMLGIVAHDLKNPLSNIRLLARLMATHTDIPSSEEIRECATDIDTMVGRMFELISNLLDINKIETHGITVHNTECNAGEITRTVVNNYMHHAANKDIEIRFSDTSDGTPVTTDPTLLRQIVDNLLSNAIKFSPFHSTVHVRFAIDQPIWWIEVEDEGPGMTEEDRRKLFTKFARLSARPTGDESSTGLGLSIVKKMAEALHGDICCNSTHGKGTLFIARFPVSVASNTEESDL